MDGQKENFTSATNKKSGSDSVTMGAMKIVQTTITSMGIVTNLIVVVVFLNNRKLRQKIPNICIINQVRNNFRTYIVPSTGMHSSDVPIFSYKSSNRLQGPNIYISRLNPKL